MNRRVGLTAGRGKTRGRGVAKFRLAPVVHAMALAMTAGSAAAAGPAFSPGWFADKRATQQAAATGRLPGGGIAGIPNAQREQQRSREQLQRSLVNLNRTAAMIAAQQSAQAAARQAALNGASAVPDGMAEGGLKVDRNPLTAGGERQGADRQVAGSGEWPYPSRPEYRTRNESNSARRSTPSRST